MAKGHENLIPLNKRSKEAQREIQELGRQANKLKIQQRKTLAEELLALLSVGDTQKNMTLAQVEKALKGDTKAYEVIRDTIGEKPTDKLETKGEQKIIVELQGDVAEWGQ